MKVQTYDEKINEFTDWVSGTNSLTGGNDTNNLPVSGARIRELLQEKLKNPVYIYRDKTAHLYRVFSSVDAWRTWDSDQVKYSSLEITNFVAPSEYGVKVELTSSINYIRAGVPGQEGSKIKYKWEVSDDKGNIIDENMSITYSIRENGKSFPIIKRPTETTVEEEMFPYLSMGVNTIDITFKGVTTGATTMKSVTINVLQLNVSSSLEYTILQRNLSTLQFGMYADRNIKGPLSFKTCRYYYGSNTLEEGAQETSTNTFNISASEENNLTPSADYRESGASDLINMKAGMHTVQVWGQMVIDNQIFYSNLLYYIIAVGYEQGGEQKIDGLTLEYGLDNRIDFVGPTEFTILATQYEPLTFNWGYIRYVDGKQSNINWYLRDINESDSEDKTETFIASYNCIANSQAPTFRFIPTQSTSVGRKTYLVAYRDSLEIIAIPIQIAESSLGISETTGIDLQLKLSAYGRQNDSTSVDEWEYGEYYTTFEGLRWNEANGWYDNSLRLAGQSSSAVINYNPFYQANVSTKGITIEIEFESEFVSSTSDELIRIGSSINSQPHISIFANKASLYIQGNPIITTNYKANERVKLAFIIEPASGVASEIRNTIFIVNNGIAERAAGWKDYQDYSVFTSNSGNIRIGGVGSGVRVYNIRCYSKAITITNAYDNYVYDSDNKSEIVANNNIYETGVINLEKCQNKLDVIVISGNLDRVLERNSTKENSNTACNIQRICVKDPSKNFTITHGRIRKHGQSTLNYPLTSYKIWTNSSVDETDPTMTIDASSDLPFAKNRYQMKDNSIPANKFVLQANYADSSGVHNGGFLRLIQDTWYNAKIDDEYKLRTPPQLFTSNQVISLQQGDDSNSEITNRLFRGYNELGRQWNNYFGDIKFPYIIRNAPDSFPCVVFYQNEDNGDTAPSFLGQYVFMDDKKSDFVYGERSIYKVENLQAGTNNANDPFCVRSDNSGNAIWNEKEGVKIWDNKNVLRIEVLSVNSTLSDYRGYTADNSGRRFDNVILGNNMNNTSIGWEEDFELVYPDKEDITTNKQFDPQKFVTTVKPFTDWLDWLIGTYQNQAKFQNEAASHLDLYKMAAYYIFVLRFGLVDSLERNAQIKTYDGVHFHYEPWDMDIALGNRNTGGIAFDPPIDRNTMMDSDTAAISGKSRIDTNNDTIPDTMVSNWLFDALENWPYWMETIVPKVADALFKAGLTYQNVIDVLDNDYQNAWCESIYNESGNFKYVVNRQNTDDNGNILSGYNDDWLAWLQGARTTHRHWWLKTSMDYYDAKWGVGEFTQKRMYFACEMHNVQGTINIVPTSETYFSFLRESTKFGPFGASPVGTVPGPLYFNVQNINSGAKVPFYINGANFIKEIDISDIASGLQVFSIANAYSSEVGPLITKVNIGVPIITETSSHLEGGENRKDVTIEAGNALDVIEELNIRGQKGIKSLGFLNNSKTISKLLAAGSGLNTLNSAIGTDYDTLELPDTLTSITFNSTTWNPTKLSFWISTSGTVVTHTYQQEVTDEFGNIVYEEDGVTPVMEEYQVEEITSSQYDKYNLNNLQIQTSIPRNLLSVKFTGTTGRYACARQFVGDWINSIIAWGTDDWDNQQNGAGNYQTLNEYLDSLFAERTLSVENIYWDNLSIPGLSFSQLEYISKFNDIDYTQSFNKHPNIDNFSKGYVMLTDNQELTTIQTSNLLTWFGDGAFTLNSGGLVIDQNLLYTAISVGPAARTVNGNIYLKEGDSARISATRFKLQSDLSETSFMLRTPGSQLAGTQYVYPNGSGNVACSIESNNIGDDFIYYLKTYPNSTGQDYTVELVSGANSVEIHVEALDYPEQIFLSAEGVKKESNVGNSTTSYRYFNTADLFVIGQQTGNILFGIQFKEGDRWVNDPKRGNVTVDYVKFKLYKDGQLCSAFTNGLDYTYFTKNETTSQTFVDSQVTELSFTTGYRATSDVYKYFIPLYVQGSVTTTPGVYTLTADIKIGGMTSTLSQKIIVVRDYEVAPAGTALWGLINNAYVQQFSQNYEEIPFYASMCQILTGDISVDGQYQQGSSFVNVSDNLNTLTSLVYNNKSIFESLPKIQGIKLDGATSITSQISGINNLPISGLLDLRRFSIQNCTGLTQDIDLSSCSELREVDASGTNINILVPTGSKLTKYELGTPTQISIVDPTSLAPSGVNVDSVLSLNSLEIVNIPNNKSFTMFGKIMGVNN